MHDSQELSHFLDKLFNRRSTADRLLNSVRKQAEFIGISAPQMSRIRNGSVPLTASIARKIAYAVGETDEEKSALFKQLKTFCGRKNPQDMTLEEIEAAIAHHEEQISLHREQLESYVWIRDNFEVWSKSHQVARKIRD